MVFSVPVQGAGKSSVKIATSALPPGIVNFVVLGPQAEYSLYAGVQCFCKRFIDRD
jgi:hypothetical protein